VIYCQGFVAHVRIKRVTRVHCSHAWIESEAADALTTLRAIASRPGISRELWVFLPRGAFRFYRVTDTGLVELDRDGVVRPEKPKPVFEAKPKILTQPASVLNLTEGPGKPEPAASPAGTGGPDSTPP
jgi:hypothetical protein